ncbi:MAG: hypothetical protein QXT48_04065, partial [Thermoplasmatales archaeon]
YLNQKVEQIIQELQPSETIYVEDIEVFPVTGLLLVALYYPVYFYNIGYAIRTRWGYILTIKIITVVAMYSIMYGNNLWHGKLIPKLAEAGNFEELKKVRKISHMLSFITVALMIAIVLIAEILAGVFF